MFNSYDTYIIQCREGSYDIKQNLPIPLKNDSAYLWAYELSSRVFADCFRQVSGLSTMQEHIYPVSLLSYDVVNFENLARESHPNFEMYDPRFAALIGILHDTVEDAEDNGFSPVLVREAIFEICGEDVLHEVNLMTMNAFPDARSKEESDILEMNEWLDRIPRMRPETQIVKSTDIFINNDGKPIRLTKYQTWQALIPALASSSPVFSSLVQNKFDRMYGHFAQQNTISIPQIKTQLCEAVVGGNA
jgi:hypothetical protein